MRFLHQPVFSTSTCSVAIGLTGAKIHKNRMMQGKKETNLAEIYHFFVFNSLNN